MKKITALLIIFSLIITNIYASGVNDGTSGTNIGEGNGINKGDAVSLNKSGNGITINVGGTAATSGTKFRTTSYNVTVQTPSGTSYVTIDVDDGGATGSTINHGVDLHSNATGTSINDRLIAAGEPSITDALANGSVTLVFDAVIEVYDGATGNVLGTYDKDSLGDPNADPQIPGTLYGDYTWGANTVIELDDYFGRNIPLPVVLPPTNPPADPSGGGGTPTPTPSPSGGGGGTTLNATPVSVTVTEPTPSAKIGADTIGSEPFDVTQGIPSGESIYADVTTGQYKVNAEFVNFTGNYEFDVTVDASVTYEYLIQDRDPVTGDLLWEDAAKTNPTMVPTTSTLPYSQVVSVTKPFSFYAISQFALYNISNVEVQNGSVDSITMPTLSSPSASVANYNNLDDHFTYNNNVYAGSFTMSAVPGTGGPDLSSYADVDLFVNNDSLVLNGQVIMSDTPTKTNAPTPITSISVPSTTGGTLFSSGNTIPSTRANGNYASITQVTYALSGSSIGSNIGTQVLNIPTNSVVVHTPVVSYPVINSATLVDQRLDHSVTASYIVIDQPFTVEYPNSGQHLSIPGYGDRDYSQYTSEKRVKFPFDVYYGDENGGTSNYHQYNSDPDLGWITLNKSQEDFTFFIPHWVEEGDYSVLFQSRAINATTGSGYQNFANTSRNNYRAVGSINVVVSGQVYDFTINSTTDKMWETFFFDNDGDHTGNVFEPGFYDKHRKTITPDYILPIMPGKNDETGYQNHTVAVGSVVNYSIKTAGQNYIDNDDAIVIIPSFKYSSGACDVLEPVDVYVKEGDKYVPYNSSTLDINASLNHEYNNIVEQDLRDTVYAYWLQDQLGYSDLADFRMKYMYDLFKKDNDLGTLSNIVIPASQRVFIGSTQTNVPSHFASDVSLQMIAKKGIHEWYGEFYLPEDSIIVPTGTAREDVFNDKYEKGYVIVHFEIYTVDGYDPNNVSYELGYDAFSSMWEVEGYDITQCHFEEGDVIVIDLSREASDDYKPTGTH